MAENIETTSSSDWFDAEIVKDKPTFFGGAVFFTLCMIAIFANVAYGATTTAVLGVVSILIGLLVIFWILDSWKSKELRLPINTLLLPIAGLILIGIVQLLPLSSPEVANDLLQTSPVSSLSLDPYATRFAVLKLIIFFVFFAAALTFINSQKRLRRIVVTVIVFASIMAFFGVLQRLANVEDIYGIREVQQATPFASYINQHHFAAFLEMTIGLTLSLIIGGGTKRDKLFLLGIAVVLMGIGIIFTGSRGGLISLVGVIGFLLLMNILNRKPNPENASNEAVEKPNVLKKNLIMIGGSVLLVLILMVSVTYLGGGNSVLRGTGLQEANQTDFTNGRIHFWNTTLEIIKENPIIGAGLEAFGVAYTKHDTWNGQFRVEHAHNDYLQVIADSGILGFICIIAFIILLFKQSFKVINTTSDNFRRNVAIGSLAGCFGIMIHSIFDFPLRTNANVFFFLILVTLAIVQINYPKLYRKRVKVRKENKR